MSACELIGAVIPEGPFQQVAVVIGVVETAYIAGIPFDAPGAAVDSGRGVSEGEFIDVQQVEFLPRAGKLSTAHFPLLIQEQGGYIMLSEFPGIGERGPEDALLPFLLAEVQVAVFQGIRAHAEFVVAFGETPRHDIISVGKGLGCDVPPVPIELEGRLQAFQERKGILYLGRRLQLEGAGPVVASVLGSVFGVGHEGIPCTHGRGGHALVLGIFFPFIGLGHEGKGVHQAEGNRAADGGVGEGQGTGLVVILDHHPQIEGNEDVLGGTGVDVGPDIGPGVVMPFEESFLVLVAAADEVFDLVVPAADAQVVLVHERGPVQGFGPVGVLDSVRKVPVGGGGDFPVREVGLGIGHTVHHLVQLVSQVVILHVLGPVHHPGKGGGVGEDQSAGIGDRGGSFRTPFGGHENDPVRSFHAVDGTGRGVLQYGNGLDVGGIDRVHVTLDSVHEHQHGSGIVVGGVSADQDGYLVGSGLSEGLLGDQAGELAHQGLGHVAHRTLFELCGGHGHD